MKGMNGLGIFTFLTGVVMLIIGLLGSDWYNTNEFSLILPIVGAFFMFLGIIIYAIAEYKKKG
jgi:hypothetical protein